MSEVDNFVYLPSVYEDNFYSSNILLTSEISPWCTRLNFKFILTFEAGNCVSNSSFKCQKKKLKHFEMTRVNNLLTIHNYVIMNTYLSDIICDLLESRDPDGQPIPIPILTAGREWYAERAMLWRAAKCQAETTRANLLVQMSGRQLQSANLVLCKYHLPRQQ